VIVSGILRTRKEPEANLWIINATHARLMFCATMARNLFYQILRVICLNEKNISSQWRSKDILAAIKNVFNNIISSFKIAYTPNEHITINGQIVVLRDKCLFCVYKIKTEKARDQSMGCCCYK
jgi:hypothetical protein